MRHSGVRAVNVRSIAGIVVAFLALAFSASEGYALSCRAPTVDEALRGADVIFLGDVLEYRLPPPANVQGGGGQPAPSFFEAAYIGKYRVRTVWKGQIPDTVEIHHYVWGGMPRSVDQIPRQQNQIITAGIDKTGQLVTGICSLGPQGGAAAFLPALQIYGAKADEHERRTRVVPGDVNAWLDKAKFLEEYRDRRGAVAAYARAAGLAPRNADILVSLARVLYDLDRFDETIQAAAKALALRADDAEARRLRDHALFKSDRAAEVDFTKTDFSGLRNYVDLRQIPLDLSGLSLDGARFVGAQLQGIRLAGASLKSADFSGATLNRVNFAGANLSGANMANSRQYRSDYKDALLQGANLSGASLGGSAFDGADLRQVRGLGAGFEGASLQGARFDGGNFSAARFVGALSANVDFADADLSQANFKEADLRGANLSRARLDGATFEGARVDCATRWPSSFNAVALGAVPVTRDCAPTSSKPDYAGKVLQHLSLNDADLRGVSFARANLAFVRFWNANLEGADFSSAQVGAEFRGANLRGAIFLGAQAQGARFTGFSGPAADITGAVFRGVRLDPRNFVASDPRMTSVDLASADFRGAVFACINAQSPLGFDPGRYNALLPRGNCPQSYATKPVLRGVDIRNADWYNVNLRGIDLTGADLRGANLTSADLTDAMLDRADLRGARYDERTIWPGSYDLSSMARERGLIFAKIVNVVVDGRQGFTTSPWGYRPEDVIRGPLPRGDAAAVPVPDLAGQALEGINLLGAWLPGSRLDRAALKDANLNGANLQKASLQGADLRGANFDRALLQGADLREARYDAKTVWPAGFDPVAAGAQLVN
jgi:uncharacterized protein YjbI with pentapeptide repeats